MIRVHVRMRDGSKQVFNADAADTDEALRMVREELGEQMRMAWAAVPACPPGLTPADFPAVPA